MSEWNNLWENIPYWLAFEDLGPSEQGEPMLSREYLNWRNRVKAEGDVIEGAYDDACKEIVDLYMKINKLQNIVNNVKLIMKKVDDEQFIAKWASIEGMWSALKEITSDNTSAETITEEES